MKASLIKLLFEEYKQNCLFSEFEKLGLDMRNLTVNNFDIVLDLVGFPKDNTTEYDFDLINYGEGSRDESKKIPDAYVFCRDWLSDKYYDMTFSIKKVQKIEVTDNGLRMTEHDDVKLIREVLAEYVDWLYQEYLNL